MKKVLILAVAILLVATGISFAGIQGSKHDLSSSQGNTVSSNTNAICVFCHTPHASNTAMTAAPLWNRSANTTGWTNTAYSSSTMNGSSSAPNSANAISKACLSCHDGNVGDEALVNGPGSGTTDNVTWSNANITGVANLNDGTLGLSNDHPIGLDMSTIQGEDSGIKNTPSDASLRLFGGLVECATCHSVHNSTTSQPFLAMDNAASAMCLACHNK